LVRIFAPKELDTTGEGHCITRSLMICTFHQILLVWKNQGERDGRDIQHVAKRRHTCTGFGGKSDGRNYLEDKIKDGRTLQKWISMKWDRGRWED